MSSTSVPAAPIGCYVHIPFCVRKCAYCDFNSYSGYTGAQVARYVAALEREIGSGPPVPTRQEEAPVDTVFFGGGTPTAIPAQDEARLLRAVLDALPVTDDVETTTEANPGTMDVAQLGVLREAGFNRISFGIQSFDAGLLQTMDRVHSAEEAKGALRAARSVGFGNVSLDLMYGLPRQTLAQWVDSLDQALALGPDHLSLYSLIVEEGTGFYTLQRKGRLPLPSDDLAADMFALAQQKTAEAGYGQYEIANFAKPGRESRHNLHYWRNEPYHGFGCGAASYLNGVRRMIVKAPAKYADAVERGVDLTLTSETLTWEETMAETMMLGLRLTSEGVSRSRFAARFGVDPCVVFASEVETFTRRGLLEVCGDALRLTPGGVFLASEVMVAFV